MKGGRGLRKDRADRFDRNDNLAVTRALRKCAALAIIVLVLEEIDRPFALAGRELTSVTRSASLFWVTLMRSKFKISRIRLNADDAGKGLLKAK